MRKLQYLIVHNVRIHTSTTEREWKIFGTGLHKRESKINWILTDKQHPLSPKHTEHNIVLTRTYRIRYFFGLPLSSNIANVEKMCTKTELLNMMGLQFA